MTPLLPSTTLNCNRLCKLMRSDKRLPKQLVQALRHTSAALHSGLVRLLRPIPVIALGVAMASNTSSLWAQTPASAAASTAPRPKTVELQTNTSTKPAAWQDLHPDQKLALQPLAKIWNTLASGQQLKWLTLASNFKKMSQDDQLKLQSRMHEWASLGMRERDQARIGFAETRQLSDEQKKAKWEAYQALSPQEKQALAQQNPPKVGLAAKSTAPVPADKKVNMPKAAAPTASSTASAPLAGAMEKRKPRLAAVPEKVSPNTLLPTDKH